MRILSMLLILAMLMSFAACASDPAPADTTDPAASADTTPAETDPPTPEIPDWQKAFEVTSADGSYTLSFSEPSVVVQGDAGDTAWGHYTFPSLTKTEDGFIRCAWHYGSDDIKYSASAGARVSVNGGKSWLMATAVDKPARTLLMEDGKLFHRL